MSHESVTANPAVKRIKRDLARFTIDQTAHSMYHIEPVSEDDILQLKGYVYGPSDTPYQGGVFHLKMTVPQEYPFSPPKIIMATKVWHPNISKSGNICLDTLGVNWTASMTIGTSMISVQALLSSPNPDSGLNAEITYLMKKYPETHQKTAAFWTYHYAVENKTEQMIRDSAPFEEMISQVIAQSSMINYEQALNILSYNGWNLPKALILARKCSKVVKSNRP